MVRGRQRKRHIRSVSTSWSSGPIPGRGRHRDKPRQNKLLAEVETCLANGGLSQADLAEQYFRASLRREARGEGAILCRYVR